MLGKSVLNALTLGVERTCAEGCRGGAACAGTGRCDERYYLATTQADWAAPARRIASEVASSGRCRFHLSREAVASELRVTLDGAEVSSGDDGWRLTDSTALRFGGASCAQLVQNDAEVAITSQR